MLLEVRFIVSPLSSVIVPESPSAIVVHHVSDLGTVCQPDLPRKESHILIIDCIMQALVVQSLILIAFIPYLS